MKAPDWEFLNRLVFETAKTLQDGRHATADDWSTIAEDLERAQKLAQAEANRLAEIEEAR